MNSGFSIDRDTKMAVSLSPTIYRCAMVLTLVEKFLYFVNNFFVNNYLIQNNQAVKKGCRAMVKKDAKSKLAAKKWL